VEDKNEDMDSSKPSDPGADQDDVNALDSPGSEEVIDATSSASSSSTPLSSDPTSGISPGKKGAKAMLKKFNVYLLFFVFILVIAGVIVGVAYFQSKKSATTSTIKTQTLTDNTLKQVANSDANVGSTQQVLNVLSSAVFAGKVLVRQDLEVAGNLQIGGTVGLTNITVSGTTQLGQVQINKNLEVAGDTALQGSTTIAKNLQVSGSASFSGPVSAPQVTTTTFQLNGDLTLTHHIVTGGGTPGRNGGPALGGGGSASVSGSDTAGTVTINTGSSPPAGCFVTVNFTQKYNSTPHVLLTPVGSAGGGLSYYVNRSTTNFSICVSNAPPAGSSFGFDYFVIN
jgi:cytoskeletal protein CcmA (bactofilin family)